MNEAGIRYGPVFRSVPNSAEVPPDEEADGISGTTVHRVVKDSAEAAGIDRDAVATHSLRRGHITQCALNGVPFYRIQKHAGHSKPETTAGYIEDAKRMMEKTSKELGI